MESCAVNLKSPKVNRSSQHRIWELKRWKSNIGEVSVAGKAVLYNEVCEIKWIKAASHLERRYLRKKDISGESKNLENIRV